MKIKRTLQPFHDTENNQIVFGLGNQSLERTLPYSKRLESLIKYLDETELDNINVNNFSPLEKKMYDSLSEKGLLTKNTYSNSKYSRNYNFYEWIDPDNCSNPQKYQSILHDSHILIVGLGGIGGTLSEILARLGVGNLTIVDFDLVETSNLTRQSVYQKTDIGQPKITSTANYLNSISDANIHTINQSIQQKNDLDNIIASNNFDILICCADTPHFEIDFWFDEIAHEYNVPYVSGSYASTVINCHIIVPNETISVKEFYGEYAITDNNLLDSKIPTAIIAPVAYMAAGLIAYRTFSFLTQLNYQPIAVQIDLLDWSIHQFDLRK